METRITHLPSQRLHFLVYMASMGSRIMGLVNCESSGIRIHESVWIDKRFQWQECESAI